MVVHERKCLVLASITVINLNDSFYRPYKPYKPYMTYKPYYLKS